MNTARTIYLATKRRILLTNINPLTTVSFSERLRVVLLTPNIQSLPGNIYYLLSFGLLFYDV